MSRFHVTSATTMRLSNMHPKCCQNIHVEFPLHPPCFLIETEGENGVQKNPQKTNNPKSTVIPRDTTGLKSSSAIITNYPTYYSSCANRAIVVLLLRF